MRLSFLTDRRRRFIAWWRAPALRADRVRGAVVGAVGGAWVGFFLAIGWIAGPVLAGTVGLCLFAASALGVVLGLVFPKGMTVALLPLSVFGIGSL